MSVCRVCLCSKPRKDIAQLNLIENTEKQSYEDVMLFCLGIQIVKDSIISTKLCTKCYKKIGEFYRFKNLALKNDAHLRALELSGPKNEIYLNNANIKRENLTEDSDNENYEDAVVHVKQDVNYEEPLIYIKENGNGEAELVVVKEECKQEGQSDDELLSDIQKIKHDSAEETKENAPVKKKRGRPKKLPTLLTKRVKTVNETKICTECGLAVKNLRTHALRHLPIEKRKQFKCEICDKYFLSNPAKRKHIKRKHLAIKMQCHLCDKAVLNIKQHILRIHDTDSLKFECVSCSRRFQSQAHLDLHITIHTKDKPHECSICGKRFRLKLSLVQHKLQVHDKEKSHLCQFCSKSFFKKYHLQVHLRSHTNEKPYPCPDCGKHFTSSSTLKNHRLTHGKEKNFICDHCNMSFVSRNYLRAHLISHVKDKRYPCTFCGVRFHRSDHRKRHEYTAHLQENPTGKTRKVRNALPAPPADTPDGNGQEAP